jgi:hypothetical protein
MGERIELPQMPGGSEEDQLRQMYSYLYRMAETLNHNLSEIGSMDLTDSERLAMQQIIAYGESSGSDGEYIPAHNWQAKESLKSLIIKTAEWVTNKLDEYRISLLGEYVADGKFGRYTRNTQLKVDITPEGIQQNYSFEEVVQGLKTYTINAKNYIKTGMLREVQGIPVYGVQVGKDIVTFAEDGEETYVDSNKVAEFTADELSFYHENVKLASYTGNAITFYSGGKKLAELKPGELAFYQGADSLGNELKAMSLKDTGLTFASGGKKLAEMKPGELAFYQGTDLQGNEVKVMSLKGTALEFYYNGALRSKMDGNGTSFYKGNDLVNDLLAEMTGTALKFYQNGVLMAEFSTVSPPTTPATNIINMYENVQLPSQVNDPKGITLISGASEVDIYPTEIMLRSGASQVNIDPNQIDIGDWKFDIYGQTYFNYLDQYAAAKTALLQFGSWAYKRNDTRAGVFTENGANGARVILFAKNRESLSDPTKTDKDMSLIFDYEGYSIGWPHPCLYPSVDGVDEYGYLSGICLGKAGKRFQAIETYRLYAPTIQAKDSSNHGSVATEFLYAPYIEAFVSGGGGYVSTNTVAYDTLQQRSSREIKHDIRELEDVGEKLDQLRPVTYIYDDDEKEKLHTGLIYEETIEVMPEICSREEDKKGINYVELVPMLLKEIQSLRARVEELERRNG